MCFAFAGIWINSIAPNYIKLDKDFSFSADLISKDDFFNEENNSYEGAIYSKTRFSYETIVSTTDHSTIKNDFVVKTFSNQPLFEVSRLYKINRLTWLREDASDGDTKGYLFAPQNLKRGEEFIYWHVNYNVPSKMRYVSDERVNGLNTFLYETFYKDVDVDQTKDLEHLPEVGETRGIKLQPHLKIWIEPLTGRLVKYEDDTIAYYYNLESGEILHPWNHFSNSFTEQSILDNVSLIKSEKTIHSLTQKYVPALLFLVALTFLFFSIYSENGKEIIQSVRYMVFVRLIGLFVFVVSCLSFVGWIIDEPALIRIIPQASAMNPVTAICFAGLGSSLVLYKVWDNRATRFLGLGVVLIGTIRFAETIQLHDFSIDLLLFRDTVLHYPILARMAQYTAISFLLLGLVPLIFASTYCRKIQLTEIVTSSVFILSLLALFNFLFDSLNFFNLPIFFSAAVHTALLFLILSATFFYIYRNGDEYRLGTKGWFSVNMVLFLLVLLTVTFSTLIYNSLTKDAQKDFLNQTARVARDIEDRVRVYENMLHGAEGLLSASDSVSRDDWKTYIDSLDIDTHHPGVQGVGYTIFIPQYEIEEHNENIRSEGFADYAIHPEGERDLYSSIIYLEPFDNRNQQAFGFDMYQEPNRRRAMELARDSGEPVMSAKVTLVQEIDEDVQPGFLLYVPHYKKNATIDNLDARRENIVGYAYAAFRARNFIESIVGFNSIERIALRIDDGYIADVGESVLYDDREYVLSEVNSSRFTDTKIIFVAGRPWRLTFYSSSDYGLNDYSKYATYIVAFTGILISVLVSLMFYTLLSSRLRALAYAAKATEDLSKAQAQLKQKLDEATRLNRIMVDRELKMVEMKEKLSKQSGGQQNDYGA
jgi:CHASE1-domain containing sensor protein